MLAARWLGLEPAAGRYFLLGTASLSALGYEHDASEPVIRLWDDTRHVDERGRTCKRARSSDDHAERDTVFLVDVDNTLLDNDRIQDDIRRHLEREFGPACRDRYWAILEQLLDELGYRDYLGALQRYRVEHPLDIDLLAMSSFLVNYPFANRLYPGSLDVLERLGALGADGDPLRRRRGLPAAQGRALRPRRGGRAAACSSTSTRSARSTTSSGATRRGTTSWWTTSRASSPR